MSTLFLIGNGFDAAHHIQTSYSAFRSFLEKEHEDFLTSFPHPYCERVARAEYRRDGE